LQDLHDFI